MYVWLSVYGGAGGVLYVGAVPDLDHLEFEMRF